MIKFTLKRTGLTEWELIRILGNNYHWLRIAFIIWRFFERNWLDGHTSFNIFRICNYRVADRKAREADIVDKLKEARIEALGLSNTRLPYERMAIFAKFARDRVL